MAKKKTLGRGLEALLGGAFNADLQAAEPDQKQPLAQPQVPVETQIKKLPLDVVQRGRYQPRTDMNPDKLEELAISIKAQGVVQPIIVRPIDGQRYEIIAGERRWRASQLAGLHEVPAIIREVPDEAAMAISLIENIQRENLNPLEEAIGLQRLIKEFDMTHQIMADAVGKSRSAISNLLRILELNADVRRLLENGDLELGHAKVLLGVKGAQQSEAAKAVVAKDLSVRETELMIKTMTQPNAAAKEKTLDPNIRRLQDDLSEKIGAKVQLSSGRRGKGKMVIQYNSLDELEGILAHIR